MKDPYSVLGLGKDATSEELSAAYERLKAEYSEQRFKEGEEGNEGARRLSELEDAWLLIGADLDSRRNTEEFGSDFGKVEVLIKDGKYDDAQAALDAVASRNGYWHYLQSIIFYKREWMQESYKQLQLAVELEPDNQKYKDALERLEKVMANPRTDPQNLGTPPPVVNNDAAAAGNCLSNCCMAYCCSELCCNAMRCCG